MENPTVRICGLAWLTPKDIVIILKLSVYMEMRLYMFWSVLLIPVVVIIDMTDGSKKYARKMGREE